MTILLVWVLTAARGKSQGRSQKSELKTRWDIHTRARVGHVCPRLGWVAVDYLPINSNQHLLANVEEP